MKAIEHSKLAVITKVHLLSESDKNEHCDLPTAITAVLNNETMRMEHNENEALIQSQEAYVLTKLDEIEAYFNKKLKAADFEPTSLDSIVYNLKGISLFLDYAISDCNGLQMTVECVDVQNEEGEHLTAIEPRIQAMLTQLVTWLNKDMENQQCGHTTLNDFYRYEYSA